MNNVRNISDLEFMNTVNKILEKHKDVLNSLAPYDTLEYEIGQWLVHNKEDLLESLEALKKDKTELFPESLYEVYLHQFEEAAIHIIRTEVSRALNLDPESSMRVNKESISLTVPELLSSKKR